MDPDAPWSVFVCFWFLRVVFLFGRRAARGARRRTVSTMSTEGRNATYAAPGRDYRTRWRNRKRTSHSLPGPADTETRHSHRTHDILLASHDMRGLPHQGTRATPHADTRATDNTMTHTPLTHDIIQHTLTRDTAPHAPLTQTLCICSRPPSPQTNRSRTRLHTSKSRAADV